MNLKITGDFFQIYLQGNEERKPGSFTVTTAFLGKFCFPLTVLRKDFMEEATNAVENVSTSEQIKNSHFLEQISKLI